MQMTNKVGQGKPEKPRILFLYSEYVGYLDGLMRTLVSDYGTQVHVVSWDKNLLKPRIIPEIPGVTFYRRSDFNLSALSQLLESLEPNIVYVSGWMDRGYLSALGKCSNRSTFKTVSGFDDNWFGTIRQRLGSIFFRIFLRKYFDVAWVAGARQYHFARQMGFLDGEIVFDMLSCNSDLFVFRQKDIVERYALPERSFFYVGNFRTEKGTDLLITAFETYRNVLGGTWPLVCIGTGDFEGELSARDGIQLIPFLGHSELIETVKPFSVFVLPSRQDQWGVAMHEFAALGYPLLSSKGAGASDHFLINAYNGWTFEPGNPSDLARKMKEIESCNTAKLTVFGDRSRQLACRITSQISAASLMSVRNG